MTTTHDILREGADSVFRYVERTAERVPDGIRWQTLSYENVPYYDASVFNGVGGIPLFLADYCHLTGDQQALALGIGGVRWCLAGDRTWAGGAANESLCFGRSGVGLAALRLAQVSGDGDLLAQARETAERVLAAPLGSVTDFIGGVAGQCMFLLRLWEETHDERFLSEAVRRAVWLDERATRDEAGCHWPVEIGSARGHTSLGFAHGIAGIGHVFLLLHHAASDARWAGPAREVAETLVRQAKPDRDGLNWPVVLGRGDTPACQWCHGSPGIGLFFAKAHEVLGEQHYLQIAKAAGETTFARGDVRHNPSQCHGLAGNAELFVELYRLTHEPRWLARAHDFAQRCLAYRTATPDGDTWQADEPGFSSPDFMSGAAGTGHFFLRLLSPDSLRMPLQ
jgi:lantibiotic modifying enzyme